MKLLLLIRLFNRHKWLRTASLIIATPFYGGYALINMLAITAGYTEALFYGAILTVVAIAHFLWTTRD